MPLQKKQYIPVGLIILNLSSFEQDSVQLTYHISCKIELQKVYKIFR